MIKFDESYDLLKDMYLDVYYPEFLVDEIYELMRILIMALESQNRNTAFVQEQLDCMTEGINDLLCQFQENDSNLEERADQCIDESIQFILDYFTINIDIETALRYKQW